MSYVRSRIQRMKRRPQGHRGLAPMRGRALGDDTSSLPNYCYPTDPTWFQIPGNPGQNGVPDYATALTVCAPFAATQSPDTFSDLVSGTVGQTACRQQATADAQRFANSANDIETNWNPAGTDFAPDDLWKIVQQMLLLSSQASSVLIQPTGSIGTSDAARAVINGFVDALRDINTQSLNYKAAYQQAKASGAKAVSAPGLKDWITSSINTFAQAVYQGSDIACNEPWWAGALQTVFGVVSTLVAIVKAVGSIVLALGEKAIVAVEGGLDMIAMIEKIAPFAAIGLAAWWLFLREKKRGEKAFAL